MRCASAGWLRGASGRKRWRRVEESGVWSGCFCLSAAGTSTNPPTNARRWDFQEQYWASGSERRTQAPAQRLGDTTSPALRALHRHKPIPLAFLFPSPPVRQRHLLFACARTCACMHTFVRPSGPKPQPRLGDRPRSGCLSRPDLPALARTYTLNS